MSFLSIHRSCGNIALMRVSMSDSQTQNYKVHKIIKNLIFMMMFHHIAAVVSGFYVFMMYFVPSERVSTPAHLIAASLCFPVTCICFLFEFHLVQ